MSRLRRACLLYGTSESLLQFPRSRESLVDEVALCLCYSRDYVTQEDMNKAVRKLQEAKKHESKIDYSAM